MGRKKQSLSVNFLSLPKPFLATLLALVITQTAVLTSLVAFSISANERAKHAHALLLLSCEYNHLMHSMKEIVDSANHPHAKVNSPEFRSLASSRFRSMHDELLQMRRTSSPAERTRISQLEDLVARLETAVAQAHSTRELAKLASRDLPVLFDAFGTALNAANGQKAKEPTHLQSFRIAFFTGLITTAVLTMCTILAAFVYLTWPLRRLGLACVRLSSKTTGVRAPRRIGSAIDALQANLVRLEERLRKSDLQRKNYAALLGTLQDQRLEQVELIVADMLLHKSPETQLGAKLVSVRKSLRRVTELLATLNSVTASGRVVQHIDAGELIADAVDIVSGLATERDITINQEVEPGLTFSSDRSQILRVLTNFLSNAIKYSMPGSTVIARCAQGGNLLHFAVVDNGRGIAADDANKLFQVFSQMHVSDGHAGAGSGIGLSICKQIVEQHGGAIGYESNPAGGSIFWFQLPRSLMEAPNVVPSPKPQVRWRLPLFNVTTKTAVVCILLASVQIIVMAGVAQQMRATLQQIRDYESTRSAIVAAHAMLIDFGHWYQTMDQLVENQQLSTVGEAAFYLEDIWNQNVGLIRESNIPADVSEDLHAIARNTRVLLRLSEFVDREKPEQLLLLSTMQKADQYVWHLEKHLFLAADKLERLGIQQFARQSEQQDLLITYAAIVVFGTLFGCFIAFGAASSLVSKAEELNNKINVASLDKSMAVSVSGTDEFAALDRAFCAALNTLQRDEERRQLMLAAINHDIRTPLNSAAGTLELVEQGVFGDFDSRAESSAAVDLIYRLVHSVTGLLELEKLEAGKLELSVGVHCVHDALAEVLWQSDPAAASAGVQLVPPPMVADDVFVLCDLPRLIQVLSELVRNAIGASNRGDSVELEISATTSSTVTVSVRNSGAAFPKELRPIAFDRLRAINDQPCVGTGLPLIKRLMEHMNGTVYLHCEDSATTAFLTLPRAMSPASVAVESAQPAQ